MTEWVNRFSGQPLSTGLDIAAEFSDRPILGWIRPPVRLAYFPLFFGSLFFRVNAPYKVHVFPYKVHALVTAQFIIGLLSSKLLSPFLPSGLCSFMAFLVLLGTTTCVHREGRIGWIGGLKKQPHFSLRSFLYAIRREERVFPPAFRGLLRLSCGYSVAT